MGWVALVQAGLAIAKIIAEMSEYTGDDKIVKEAGAAFASYQRIREATKNKATLESMRLSVSPWPKE